MSTRSELSYPPIDSLVLSDFPNLAELGDPDVDIFLSNEIHEITDDTMLHDLDTKVDLKTLPMPELNDFDMSLDSDIKQVAEEDGGGGVCSSSADNDMIGFDGFKLNPISHFSPTEGKPVLPVSPNSDNENATMTDIIMSSSAQLEDSMGYSTILATTHDHEVSLEEGRLRPRDLAVTSSGLANPISMGNTSIKPCLAQNIELAASVSTLLPIIATQTPMPSLEVAGFNNGSRNNQMEPMSGFGSLTPASRCSRRIINAQVDAKAVNIPTPIVQINSPVSTATSGFGTKTSSTFKKLNILQGHDEKVMIGAMSAQQQAAAAADMISTTTDSSSSFNASVPSPRGDACQSSLQTDTCTKETEDHRTTMQRSQSSHSLGQLRSSGNLSPCPKGSTTGTSCQSQLEIQIPAFEFSGLSPFTYYQSSSPVFVEGTPVRRVFSTGDLQGLNGMQLCYGSTNPCHVHEQPLISNNEESLALKIGHYTVEERKERLHRYRQKRNERNFSKKIKYACRKTLADSRPRVRGRFARTLDDSGLGDPTFAPSQAHQNEGAPSSRLNVNGSSKCSMVKEPAGAMHWKPLRMNVAMGHGV